MEDPWREVRVGRYTGVLHAFLGESAWTAYLERLGGHVHAPDAIVIAEGRNRNVRLDAIPAGPVRSLMVKSFGRPALLKDWLDRARGSKARRTWLAARALEDAGVGTPRPLGFLEAREGGRLRESYFLSEFLKDVRTFTDELNRLFRNDPECAKFMALLQTVADAIRGMHAAGVLHNDLGNQNILLRPTGDGEWGEVRFIDLNRARAVGSLTPRQRARDLSRIYLPGDFLRVFKEMYYAPDPPPAPFQKWERWYRRAYAWHSFTRKYRHPVRAWRQRRAGGPRRTYPPETEMWVWDERSAQAINVMRSRERRRHHRVRDHLRAAWVTAAGAPTVWKEYRKLLALCYRQPVDMAGRIGVALEPLPETLDRELELLKALGAVPVLVRFYCHAGPARMEGCAEAVRKLRDSGHAVAVALVQDREASREPEHWRRFVAEIMRRVGADADRVEIGHAVNRVKWGLWTHADHAALLRGAQEAIPRGADPRLMGPAAIDFELPRLMSALRNVPAGMRFDALSHHLYVDRRGAPEQTQAGFSALHKFALVRAAARWSGCCEDRLIVSEVNWPLRGQGAYSPVGSPYVSPGPRFNDPSVTEDEYADYMLRYLLIALASGMVERVYWWRLVARGFGLVDDTDPAAWRTRPAYGMLQTLLRALDGAVFREVLGAPPGLRGAGAPPWSAWVFEKDGKRFAAAYARESGRYRLPVAAARVTNALGEETAGGGAEVALSGRVVYLWDLEER